MQSLSNKNNQFYFIKIEIEKNMLNYINGSIQMRPMFENI
jgi:hypothetical protein